MPTFTVPSDRAWPDGLKGALPLIAAAASFWAIAAALLFFLVPGLETFPRLLMFAECVGLTMAACVLMLQRTGRFAGYHAVSRQDTGDEVKFSVLSSIRERR